MANPLSVIKAIGEAGEAVSKARKAKKAVKVKSGILATPNLRDLDTEDALREALREPHLIQDKTGKYIGAPDWVKTPEDLQKMRQMFDEKVRAGITGADWYPRARETNVQWAGDDPARQRLLAQEEALWSAQANPDTNLNFALQGHNAYEMGTPLLKARTGQQAETYRTAREAGEDIKLGKKTGIYGKHLDPTRPFATTGTNDIWHARSFGYTGKEGKPFSRALTEQEHRFLDYETMLAVQRARDARLADRSDWLAHEIQAAPWVAAKGQSLAAKSAGKKTLEQGVAEASKTYPDYASKYTAFATHEQTPGIMTGHLPELVRSPFAVRKEFAEDPRSSWAPKGRDVLYDELGLYQRPPQPATGLYTPPGGATEINPAQVSRPLVGVTKGEVDPASRRALNLAEAYRSYVDAQGAGAWNKLISNAPTGKFNALFSPFSRALSQEEMTNLRDLGKKYNLGDIIDVGEGFIMTDFSGKAPSGKDLGKLAKGELKAKIQETMGTSPQRVFMDTGYLPMYETGTGEGTGEVTRNLFSLLDKYGLGAEKKLDAESLRKIVAAKMARNAELAAKTGQPLRADIQRALGYLSSGGLDALRAALMRGEALPVLAGAAVGVPALKREMSGE